MHECFLSRIKFLAMLKYVRIKPVFRVVSDLIFTEYKGATLGGMFKTALRKTCCTQSNVGCKECDYAGECIFTEITEKKSISGENTSLPYIISCSCLQSNFYEAGASISFEIIIIGKAIKHLANILASLTYWSELDIRNFPQLISENEIKLYGLPKDWPANIRPRGRLKLEQIEEISAKGPRLLYAPNLPLQVPEGGFVNLKLGLKPGLEPGGRQAETWRVMITFLSPLRILQKRKRITPQTFNPELFLGRLADRYNNFSRHFGTGAPDKNEPDYIKRKNASKRVVCLRNTLKTRQIKRYKNHLNNHVPLDGLSGEVVFDNVDNSLVPLIKTGELLHAGKSITFGYGEYKTEYFAQM